MGLNICDLTVIQQILGGLSSRCQLQGYLAANNVVLIYEFQRIFIFMDKDYASIKFRDVEVWKLVCNDQES
jgi:hypothetical protein